MSIRFRVINLTGQPLSVEDVSIRDGINFLPTVPDGFPEAVNAHDRLHLEEYCHSKSKYVPYGDAITPEDTHDPEEQEEETETDDPANASETPSETETGAISTSTDNLT